MTPNDQNLAQLFLGFSTAFNKSLKNSQSFHKDVAMVVPSSSGGNNYGWMGAFPRMREWLGDRVINSLSAHTYVVTNRTFENTVSVPREAIEDDQYDVYGLIFERLGQDAAQHPDEMVFGLLANGFSTPCYDGQPFLSASHPVGDPRAPSTVSNLQASSSPPWFLLDCGQPMKPMLFQERLPYQLEAYNNPQSDHVFFKNQFVYGVRSRCNVGLGVWQLAYGSTAPLTPANYQAARAAMMSQVSDTGRPLGVKPTHLATVPANEGAALQILKSLIVDATTNEWANTAVPVVTQFLLQPNPMVAGGSASAT
jgi:phage major head subunit gpT-like protein